MCNVIAIADIGYFRLCEVFAAFDDGHEVGHGLAGMLQVRQAIDDRNGGMRGQRGADIVAEGPDHDPVDHALQILRNIIDRLPLAEVDVGRRKEQGIAAELFDPHGEGRAGAQRRFLENQSHHRPFKRCAVFPRMGLHVARENKHRSDLRGREIIHREKVPPLQPLFPRLDGLFCHCVAPSGFCCTKRRILTMYDSAPAVATEGERVDPVPMIGQIVCRR